jgi:hypothetical protein
MSVCDQARQFAIALGAVELVNRLGVEGLGASPGTALEQVLLLKRWCEQQTRLPPASVGDAGTPRDPAAVKAAAPRIVWYGSRQYGIGDQEPITLTDTEHMVLQAFVGPPPLQTMDKPTLCKRSVEHAPRVLATLREKYGRRFAGAITTPQGKKAAGGYSVRIRPKKGAK